MFATLLDKLLDKLVTQDFWRGVLYAAAAVGLVIPTEWSTAIVATALGISGVLHMLWHKSQGTK